MSSGTERGPRLRPRWPSVTRGQSHVVGVVLLLGMTAIAMAGLTAAVGDIVAEQTSHADATRVASDFDASLRPVETTGPSDGRVHFSQGTLSVEPRELRVRNESGVLATVETDALVFESRDRRAAFVAGAIVRGRGRAAWMEREPPITGGPGVLIVGAPRLNGTFQIGGTGGVSATLSTNVSHERVELGRGEFSVAIETAAPAAFERYADTLDATSRVRDLDGDGVPSVVFDVDGTRRGYLVVHDLRLEVENG